MPKHAPLLLTLLVLSAYSCRSPVELPSPVHAVRLAGWYYLLVEDRPAGAPSARVLGAEHGRVLRRIECEGVIHVGNGRIDDPCGFQDGDSDILPAGIALHVVEDVPPAQWLGAVLDGRVLLFAVRFPPD